MFETRRYFIVIAFELCFRVRQVNQDGLKLNGTHHLLVYADDVNILSGSVHTVEKTTDVLEVASKDTGQEVTADKTQYMVMSRDQNAGRSHNIKSDNSSFSMVEQVKYFGATLTNQKSIQEEIKSRLKSGKACCQSVQNILSSSFWYPKI